MGLPIRDTLQRRSSHLSMRKILKQLSLVRPIREQYEATGMMKSMKMAPSSVNRAGLLAAKTSLPGVKQCGWVCKRRQAI